MINRQWLLTSRPEGQVKKADFQWVEKPVPDLEEGQILVRVLYLSLDPANRRWMAEGGSYMDPIPLGTVMKGSGIGRVIASRHPKWPEGTLVQGMMGWQDYLISTGKGLMAFQPIPGLPLTAFLGLFGHIGLTAYFGLLDIGKPQAGETLTITAAAGAVGSLAGQIGKIKGCRVVGIAGSDEKCSWLTNELGFDAAINYKKEKVRESLRQHCPDGIDIIFENVGGKILDAEMSLMNLRARIVLCGLISQYNATEPVPGPYQFGRLITQRARAEGFIITDYLHRAGEAIPDLAQWYSRGLLKYRMDLVEGLEHTPEALNRLFDGTNQGKLVIQVSAE